MITAQVEPVSMRKLEKDLKRLVPEAQKKFFKLAAVAIYKDVIGHFEKERGPDGKWKRFKWPDGKIRNTRPTKRGGNKMLQDTGRLKGSIVPFVESGAAGARTNLEYAGFHNDGTSKIPKREFAYVDDATMTKLEDYLAQAITDEWKK